MSDTIAAIATAPGQGGIAIVRVSGNMAEDMSGFDASHLISTIFC